MSLSISMNTSEVNILAKTSGLILCLLKPCLKLLLSHLQILDVGGCSVQERHLAGLLVGNGESVLETAITIPELVTPPLLRLDALATDFLATTNIDLSKTEGMYSNRLETYTSLEAAGTLAGAKSSSSSEKSSCLLGRRLRSRLGRAIEGTLMGL